MLDPTSDGVFVDEEGTPLSLLEMRHKFANAEFITYIQSTDSLRNLKKLKDKYTEANAYICKNLFFFYVDKDSTFGTTNEDLVFVPVNYSIKEKTIANTKYRINNLPEEYKEWIPKLENQLEKLRDYQEDIRTNIGSMIESPIK